MRKLAAAVVGALFAGLNLNGSTQSEASVNTEREARMQKLDSITEDSPVCFSQSQQAGRDSVQQWHTSHYSHSSHRSHYSHRSGW